MLEGMIASAAAFIMMTIEGERQSSLLSDFLNRIGDHSSSRGKPLVHLMPHAFVLYILSCCCYGTVYLSAVSSVIPVHEGTTETYCIP